MPFETIETKPCASSHCWVICRKCNREFKVLEAYLPEIFFCLFCGGNLRDESKGRMFEYTGV